MDTLKNLVDKGLSTRQIAKELQISPTSVRYRLSKSGLVTKHTVITRMTAEERKLSVRKRQTQNINKKRSYVWNYLLEHPCVDCGESNPVVLEFDHVNAENKSFAISRAVASGGRSLESLVAEIDKCEVRCANDHRIRTAKQFGFYALVSPIPPKD